MVPVSTIRPCLLKCLFQDPHNWVGTTLQDADTHYSIHCSSTEWLQLIHIAPLWKLLDCLLNLSAELSGRRSVLWRLDSGRVFVCDWLDTFDIYRGQLYLGSSINNTSGLVSVEMFLSLFFIMPSLWTPLALADDSVQIYRVDCSELTLSAGDPSLLHLLGLWKQLGQTHRRGGRGPTCAIFFFSSAFPRL